MATRQTTFKFDEQDLALMDDLARDLGISRTQVVRRAIRAFAANRAYDRDVGGRFLDRLRANHDPDAVMVVRLDDNFDPYALIDGQPADDIQLATLVVKLRDGQGYEENFLRIYLVDPDSEYRLLLGLMPVQAGVDLSVPLMNLGVDMRPRAVAWYVG